jgi:peptidoglycan hydrolase-like protein with peptidoglycan-binding domain
MDTLAEGSQGDNVKVLQVALNKNGAKPPLTVDGIFGPRTKAAVEQFQTDNKLHVDGIVGPETAKALHEEQHEDQGRRG